jgi:hypothetical protein
MSGSSLSEVQTSSGACRADAAGRCGQRETGAMRAGAATAATRFRPESRPQAGVRVRRMEISASSGSPVLAGRIMPVPARAMRRERKRRWRSATAAMGRPFHHATNKLHFTPGRASMR